MAGRPGRPGRLLSLDHAGGWSRFASTPTSTSALAPAHSPPKPDGSETVDAGWFGARSRPSTSTAKDEMQLVFPTIKHLESLVPFANAEEALEAARKRDVKAVEQPRSSGGKGDERRIVLPGRRCHDVQPAGAQR